MESPDSAYGVTGALEQKSRRDDGTTHPAVLPASFAVGALIAAAEITWYLAAIRTMRRHWQIHLVKGSS